jgi:hypothetical protein
MKDKLEKLRKLRNLELETKEEKDRQVNALPILKELEVIQDERTQLENEIRADAVNLYNQTGEKKFNQVGIRITKKYNYDEEQALQWAKDHNLCIALDKTAFKKQLKVQPLDFVTEEEVPTATIPVEIKENE